MKKLRRILVAVTDLDHAHVGALRRAAAFAQATGASVELFHAVTAALTQSRRLGRRRVDVELSIDHSVNLAQERLERLARSKLLQGCRVNSMAVWDKPAHAAIVRRALGISADLIITGTRARGFADRMILRHTDWELVRHSPCPLLLVKSHRVAAEPVILAAIDPLHANAKPAKLDRQILDVAGGMAALLKGTLHAVHAYMPLSVTLAAGIGEPVVWNATELDADYTRRVTREFTRALRSTDIPISRRHLRVGAAARELPACAARIRATLVVMGAVSRSGLERLFIGNTAEHVMDELACDVLIVKPREFKGTAVAGKRRLRHRIDQIFAGTQGPLDGKSSCVAP
jgi:universal stress protein E